jgi:hypothetical protein
LLIALFVVIVQEYHYLSWLNILFLFTNCQSLNTTFHVQRQNQVLRSSVGGVKICSGANLSAVYIAIGSMVSSFRNKALGDSGAFLTLVLHVVSDPFVLG